MVLSSLELRREPLLIKPADRVKCCPQSAGLVDIDLGGILCRGLVELLALAHVLKASGEDASLVGEVGITLESEDLSDLKLLWVEMHPIGVVAEIQSIRVRPLDRQLLAHSIEALQRRAVIRDVCPVSVVALDFLRGCSASAWLWLRNLSDRGSGSVERCCWSSIALCW